jgi:hypothetical protein
MSGKLKFRKRGFWTRHNGPSYQIAALGWLNIGSGVFSALAHVRFVPIADIREERLAMR